MSNHPKIEDELPKTAEMKQREKHELQVLLESISLKSQESAQEERNSRVMHTYYSHLSRLYASSYVGFFTLLLIFVVFVYTGEHRNDATYTTMKALVALFLLLAATIIACRMFAFSRKLQKNEERKYMKIQELDEEAKTIQDLDWKSRWWRLFPVGQIIVFGGFLAFGWYWFLHTGLHIIIWNAVWPHLLRMLWP